MSGANLAGGGGELRFTVEITRKATGKVETFDVIGHVTPDQLKQLMQEKSDVGDPQHISP